MGKLGYGSSKMDTYGRKLKESFMATLEILDEDTDSKDNKEEANMGIVVTTSSREEPSSNSNEDDEVISEQISNEYIPSV